MKKLKTITTVTEYRRCDYKCDKCFLGVTYEPNNTNKIDKRTKAYREFLELRNHKLTMLGIGIFYLVLFIALGQMR